MAKTHTVKKGETLTSIAQKYGTTVSALHKANSRLIKNVNKITVGWVLKLPTNGSKDYETIGKAFETALNDIRKLKSVQRLQTLIGE